MHTIQHMIKWSLYSTALAGLLLLTGVVTLLLGFEMLVLLVNISD